MRDREETERGETERGRERLRDSGGRESERLRESERQYELLCC